MAKNKNKSLWPLFIAVFIAFGIFMAYWTVKQAMSMPVQESNDYMLKYQLADININDILNKEKNFKKYYKIYIRDTITMVMTDNIHSNIPQPNRIELKKGANTFYFEVLDKDKKVISNAKVDFLLTRPFSAREDKYLINIPNTNGKYVVKDINITKAGRYTLQLRVTISDDKIGYLNTPAYLKR